jgi:hypothetical protein
MLRVISEIEREALVKRGQLCEGLAQGHWGAA